MQETERHTQGTELTHQHRLTQNTAEAEEAVHEDKPTAREKSSNHSWHNPEQAKPPKAIHQAETRPKAQDRKISSTKSRVTEYFNMIPGFSTMYLQAEFIWRSCMPG
jgi:hypothetical protein